MQTSQEVLFWQLIGQGAGANKAAAQAYRTTSPASARAIASRLMKKYRGQKLPTGVRTVPALDLSADRLENCAICRDPLSEARMQLPDSWEKILCGAADCAECATHFPKTEESSVEFLNRWQALMCARKGLVYVQCPIAGCTTRNAYKPDDDPRCLRHRTQL